jgi:alkylation response protein AidB-like acyl-CoA dehydrogenase
MERELTSEQELLRSAAARFIASTCPLPTVRQLADSPTGLPDGYLRAAAALGWFAMLVPEEHGGVEGSDARLDDLAVVAEACGRGLQPGPFVSMNVVAAALATAGTTEQRQRLLPGIVDGTTPAAWVPAGPGSAVTAGTWVTAVGDGGDGGGFVLSGRAELVQDAEQADWLLVSAGGPAGPSQFVVDAGTPGIACEPLVGLDITRRFATVAFDQVRVPPAALVGAPGGAAADVERQLQLTLALAATETVGAMDELFEMTRRYASTRVAFGRPIGSFQAVKHQLADLSLAVETSRAIADVAVDAVGAGRPAAGEIASMATSWVSDSAIDLAQGCLQVFGGIGFTWEHDAHLFVRRLTMNSLQFGQPEWHRGRVWELHGV